MAAVDKVVDIQGKTCALGAAHCRSDGICVGDFREHALHHQPIPLSDNQLGLCWRQHNQFIGRYWLDDGRIPVRCAGTVEGQPDPGVAYTF
jgi:hypothetical protein